MNPSRKELRKAYEKESRSLQEELVKLQLWIKRTGARIIIVFEGRDAAGKGGVIKRITERTSPRVFRVVALPAPSERERSQIYIQRYVQHFPAAGEIILFDRSWYNRLGVERVMGYCTDEEYERFLRVCPAFEADIIESGSLARWIWSPTGAGMTTPAPRMPSSPQGHRDISVVRRPLATRKVRTKRLLSPTGRRPRATRPPITPIGSYRRITSWPKPSSLRRHTTVVYSTRNYRPRCCRGKSIRNQVAMEQWDAAPALVAFLTASSRLIRRFLCISPGRRLANQVEDLEA